MNQILTQNIQNTINSQLQEINRIFILTKKFSGSFDDHVSKLYLMINSLLENDELNILDENFLEQQYKPFGSHNNFLGDNKNKFSEAEEKLFQSSPLDQLPNAEDPMNFMQVIKEQNLQIGQMMEIGERNAQNVQQMFNDIFNNLVKTMGSSKQTELPSDGQGQSKELQKRLDENKAQQD